MQDCSQSQHYQGKGKVHLEQVASTSQDWHIETYFLSYWYSHQWANQSNQLTSLDVLEDPKVPKYNILALSQESITGPSCCEATVLITAPLCQRTTVQNSSYQFLAVCSIDGQNHSTAHNSNNNNKQKWAESIKNTTKNIWQWVQDPDWSAAS